MRETYFCSICERSMKNPSKRSKKRCTGKLNTSTSIKKRSRKKTIRRLIDKWQMVYDKRCRRYRLIAKRAALEEYLFYSVLNTDVIMEMGVAASMITRGVLALYNKLIGDKAKQAYIDLWQKSGKNMIVLRGYDHRHLKFLARESRFLAIGKSVIYHRWYRSRIMLALTIFGRREDVEDLFCGLTYLR